ncbi:cytochrome P450 3A17 [Corynespora cassiicola Philippines]|uniref:Cytochrome P450 3A17 n=1 Tax=Corynespora cassiicola Philippines TaxID=1448308 RepID=A0A2T2NIV6_CORCC|nr:cytochrome P450 3A17 [Corynespora cassiicola Philippines]
MPNLSILSILIASLIILPSLPKPLLYFAGLAVYRLFFHPLAKVPGPKLYAISGLPKDLRNLSGSWYRDVKSFHVKYGPIVRIGPNEIGVDGDPAWEDCFSLKRAGKPEFTRDQDFFDIQNDKTPTNPSLFVTDRNGHRRQRRILAHAFSKAALSEQEPLIRKYVELLIDRVREMAKEGKPVDVVKWYNFTTFDVIGDLTFGESFDCLEQSTMHTWVSLILHTVKAGEVLRFLLKYPFTRPLTLAIMGDKMLAARADHQAFTKEKTRRRLALGPAKERNDFMSYVLKHNDEKGMSENEIIGNSEALIVAGSETTATALSGITYYLNKNPHVMHRLKEEIRTTFSSDEEITMKAAFELTYTRAVIEEGLRVFPPVVVSPGRVSPGDFVGGHYIAAGTKVTVNQFATYHNPRNFYRPDDFVPERFLPQDHPLYDSSFASDNKKSFRPFSYGPADCLGKNLAYSELHLILAKMIWNFDFQPLPENEGWAENMKGYTIWEKPPLNVKMTFAQH